MDEFSQNYAALSFSYITPYYRLSRLQMSSGTQKINKLNEIWISTFNIFHVVLFKSWIFILWHLFIFFVKKKCCIDHLLCMVDLFQLSGTTDYCNFCYRWRQIVAIGTEVLIFWACTFVRERNMFKSYGYDMNISV